MTSNHVNKSLLGNYKINDVDVDKLAEDAIEEVL